MKIANILASGGLLRFLKQSENYKSEQIY